MARNASKIVKSESIQFIVYNSLFVAKKLDVPIISNIMYSFFLLPAENRA